MVKTKSKQLKYWDLAFYSERSIEDEIEEAASADLQIFIIAYSTIFIYLAIALGQYESLKTLPRDMKISLALSSIFMIFGAAFGSIGLFGWLGIQVSYWVHRCNISKLFLVEHDCDGSDTISFTCYWR